MNDNTEHLFLHHLITLISQRITELPRISKANDPFDSGRSLAYYEVGGFIVECCRIFNVSIKDLEIPEFDPETLL